MIVDEIEYIDREHSEDLLERLSGTISHLTSRAAFDQIRKDGFTSEPGLTANPSYVVY